MIERMGKVGVRELNKDAESPIAEILKGGEWLALIGKSGFKQAFDKGFKGMVCDHHYRPSTSIQRAHKLTMTNSKEPSSANFSRDYMLEEAFPLSLLLEKEALMRPSKERVPVLGIHIRFRDP
jgi:hypothetical protein